jgi:hypothetical protein
VLGARVTGGPAQSRPYLLQTAATSPTHENSISRFNLPQGCFHFFPLSVVLYILSFRPFYFKFFFISFHFPIFIHTFLLAQSPQYSLRTTNSKKIEIVITLLSRRFILEFQKALFVEIDCFKQTRKKVHHQKVKLAFSCKTPLHVSASVRGNLQGVSVLKSRYSVITQIVNNKP